MSGFGFIAVGIAVVVFWYWLASSQIQRLEPGKRARINMGLPGVGLIFVYMGIVQVIAGRYSRLCFHHRGKPRTRLQKWIFYSGIAISLAGTIGLWMIL